MVPQAGRRTPDFSGPVRSGAGSGRSGVGEVLVRRGFQQAGRRVHRIVGPEEQAHATVGALLPLTGVDAAAPATWAPVHTWSTTLGREPDSLTLDTDHAGLVTDDGWDRIAPFIGRGLAGLDAPSPSLEILT